MFLAKAILLVGAIRVNIIVEVWERQEHGLRLFMEVIEPPVCVGHGVEGSGIHTTVLAAVVATQSVQGIFGDARLRDQGCGAFGIERKI